MEKEQIDQLYHLMRVASCSSHEELLALSQLSRHLLSGGDYLSLIQYSAFYGEKYLLEPVFKALVDHHVDFDRVVEFGAGLGWLSRGLASLYARAGLNTIGTLTIDKRAWGGIGIVADLETAEGIEEVRSSLGITDLILMCDFLHCVEDPTAFIDEFPDWPMAVLEYMPGDPEYIVSFHEQLERFGASSFIPEDLPSTFIGRDVDIVDLDMYVLVLASRRLR